MSDERNKMLNRYSIVVLFFALCALGIVIRICYTMFAKKDFWLEVAECQRSGSLDIEPLRGNIISSDGKLLSSSLPEYTLYIDFKAGGFNDTLFINHMDEITSDLHDVFPDKSKKHFRDLLNKGLKNRNARRNAKLYPDRVSFVDLKKLKTKRYFSMDPNISGFHYDAINNRKRPFGSLAERTIGDVSKNVKIGAKYGVELAYDSVLRGRKGVKHREKVKNGFIDIVDKPAVNGADVVTTLDVEMQDIVESVLRKKLKEIGAESGVAMLMEVSTGDIKAIANLGRVSDSVYVELRSYALSDLMEPGSTFKTASIMVGLDDGVISMDDVVDTGNGIKNMYGRDMRDHNWRHGGYGPLDLQHIIMYSSNIGVSELIDSHYHDNPQKFVDGLKRIGILYDWDFPLKEYLPPRVKDPNSDSWDKTALAWLSIGYNSQLPVLNTLAFYNAIANNGKLVRPRIVKSIEVNGETVREFPVEVVKEQICSPATMEKIHFLLEKVVSEGLGKKAGNEKFHVSGKTGTAMVAENGRYGNKSFISFAGYFPSEKPMYTCVVAITKRGYASGGLMSGDVFGRVAEQIYAKYVRSDIGSLVDSTAVFTPQVLKGNLSLAAQVLETLGHSGQMVGWKAGDGHTQWGSALLDGEQLDFSPMSLNEGYVPNVVGMGAMDAVYLLEGAGLNVTLSGTGKVVSQSQAAGSVARPGTTVHLHLK